MKRTILLLALAALVVAGGVGAYLMFGSQPDGTAAGAGDRQAADEFFAERGGRVAGGDNIALAGAIGGSQVPGVAGTVERIDGETIVVKGPDGKETSIRLAGGAKIMKDVEIKGDEIAVGERIAVIGRQSGDDLSADLVRLGEGAAGGAPQPQMRIEGGPQGDSLPLLSSVDGEVAAVEGESLTVRLDDGTSRTVKLRAETQIRRQESVEMPAIKAGDMLFAMGSQKDGVFEATQVILGAGQMMMIPR